MRALFLVAILVVGCGGTAAPSAPQSSAGNPTPAAATAAPTTAGATTATPTRAAATSAPTAAAATIGPTAPPPSAVATPSPAPVPTPAPPTPTPTVTVAPTEEAVQPIKVLEFGFSQSKGGSVYYGLIVQNPNTSWAAFGTGVDMTFFDGSGKKVTTLGGLFATLMPGQVAAIGGYSPSGQGAKSMDVKLSEPEWLPMAAPPVPFTVSDVVTKTTGNLMTTTGTITNTSAQPFDFVLINIIYRDGAGKIIGGWSDRTSVPANGTSDFEVPALEVLPAKATEVYLMY